MIPDIIMEEARLFVARLGHLDNHKQVPGYTEEHRTIIQGVSILITREVSDSIMGVSVFNRVEILT